MPAPAPQPPTSYVPARPVQRAADRRTIRLASGVVWERLTTESLPNVDFLYVTYEVGGASSPEHAFQRHGGQEWGYVLSGRLGVTVGFDEHVLEPGDAIALDSTVPHRLYNLGDEPVHAIWFVLGRRPVDAGAFATDSASTSSAGDD
jgi:quercetin dioxygenase-like cupin family protein